MKLNNIRVGGETIRQLAIRQQGIYDESLLNAENDATRGRAIVIVGGLLALLPGTGLAIVLTRSIIIPLRHAALGARHIADGDFTQPIDSAGRDEAAELLQALKAMQSSLATIVGEVRSGTDTIATASSQIAAGNHDLSSRTEEQASSLEETAASMEALRLARPHRSARFLPTKVCPSRCSRRKPLLHRPANRPRQVAAGNNFENGDKGCPGLQVCCRTVG